MPKRTDIRKIMVIGSGPIVIGQAAEFDYSGYTSLSLFKRGGIPSCFGQFESSYYHDR